MPHQAFVQHRTFTLPLYIILRDFGKLGFESVSDPEATRASIIDDIASGQIDRVVSVIEVFADEGHSRDVTDDIREAVEARCALALEMVAA